MMWKKLKVVTLTSALVLSLPLASVSATTTVDATLGNLLTTTSATGQLIQVIEVNQALSYDKNIQTGELNLASKFVAGKNTAILVRLNERIVGFVRNRQGADASTMGYTFGYPSNIVTESDEDMQATLAHELAHIYKVGDEYSGGSINMKVNPVLLAMKGKDWDDRDKTITANNQYFLPFSQSGDGSSIKSEVPYEFSKRGELEESVSFIGTGAKQAQNWVTAPIWNQLFDSFLPNKSTVNVTSIASTTPIAAATQQRVIELSGWINKNDTVDIANAWNAYNMDVQQYKENKTGNYAVEAVDKDGKVLATQRFDLKFYTQSNPPKAIDEVSLEGVNVAFPQGTAKFVIKRGTTEIGTKLVSANAPVIDKVTVDLNTGVSWEASDKDNDKMTYEVLYSPNGQSWSVLEGDIQTTSIKVDFNELSGGDQACIKVVANDSVNTTEKLSDPFKVSYKKPELFIYEPEEVEAGKTKTYPKYEEIYFEADAYDLQSSLKIKNHQLTTSDLSIKK